MLLKLGTCTARINGLAALLLTPIGDSGRGELTPRRMRIYANHSNIVDFSEAEDVTPQLNINLLEGETGVTEYPLRTASFANVHSLSLFFVFFLG